jgi:hypothetical protein
VKDGRDVVEYLSCLSLDVARPDKGVGAITRQLTGNEQQISSSDSLRIGTGRRSGLR